MQGYFPIETCILLKNIEKVCWCRSINLQNKSGLKIGHFELVYFYLQHSVWESPLLLSIQSRCLKITEKVSFNIASEASYVYILNGQNFIKMTKIVHFGEFLKIWSLLSNSVTRQVTYNRTTIGENDKIEKSNATFWVIFKQFVQFYTKIKWDFFLWISSNIHVGSTSKNVS